MQKGSDTNFQSHQCFYKSGTRKTEAADEVIIFPVVVRPSRVWTWRCAAVSKGCEGHRREKKKSFVRLFGACVSVDLSLAGHFPTCRPD